MGILNFLSKKSSGLAPKKRSRLGNRNFSAAKNSRFTADWITTNNSPNSEIRPALKTLRSRSRDLANNNDFAKKYFHMITSNVIGPKGIVLQAKAKNDRGELDKHDNDLIEKAWRSWGKKGNCTVDGKLSWCDVQRLVLESIAKDGEAIIRLVPGYNNTDRFALQVIEADHLDVDLNGKLKNGNQIKLGIECNEWDKPVAYHLTKKHPGNAFENRKQPERIPANQILHLYLQNRPGQSRGIPWLTPVMESLRQLGGWREAELIGLRVTASKMGFFVSPDGDGFTGEDVDDYNPIMNAEPGTFEQLPEGMRFEMFDPKRTSSDFNQFEKAVLRGVASGLNVSYTSLANDLEGVNYSSARVGMLEERDQWRLLQSFIIEHLCEPVYLAWLDMFLLSPNNPLPPRRYDKFTAIEWRARGWGYVDPDKEAKGNLLAMKSGFKSLQDILGDQGKDVEDVLEQLALEKQLLEKYGVKIEGVNTFLNQQVTEQAIDEAEV